MPINVFTLDGNLVEDSVERQYKDGKTFVTFRIAHNEMVKGEKVTDFYSCTSFSKYVIKCAPSLVKGTAVVVSGRLVHRHYADKDGADKVSYDLTVDGISLPRRSQETTQGSLYDADLPF